MELRHLRYFVAVASERNFTRAAAGLGISQPPLSRQIRELEDEFGAELFARDSRPVTLTDSGRLLLDYAQDTLNSVERLRQAMRRAIEQSRRRFVIGFVGSTIYGPIPSMIRSFRSLVPDLDIDLVEMNTLAQMSALKDGRIDAGIGRLPFEDPAIGRLVIEQEALVVALPVDHPLAVGKGRLSLRDLEQDPVILYPSEPRPSYADQVLDLFRRHGVTPGAVREVRELQTALGLAAAYSGVCIVPSAVQRLRRDDIAYCPLVEPDALSPIILSWRAADSSPAVGLLCDICARLPVTLTG
ncbi:LysR family transcriptional regulator [Sphingomonas koreensis]